MKKDIIELSIRQFISIIIQVGIVFVINNKFGISGNGAFAVFMLIVFIAQRLLNFGINSASVFFFNTGRVTSTELASTIVKIGHVIAFLGTLTLFVMHYFFATYFANNLGSDSFLIITVIYPALLMGLYTGYFQALKQYRIMILCNLLPQAISLIMLIYVYFRNDVSLASLVNWLIFAQYITFFLLSIAFVRLSKIQYTNLTASASSEFYLYGLKSYSANMMGLLNYRVDVFMLSILTSVETVGIYNIATQIVEKAWIFSQAANIVVFPRLSSLFNKKEKMKKTLKITVRFTFVYTLVAILFINLCFYLTKDYIPLEQIDDIFKMCVILIPGVIFVALSRPYGSYISAMNLPQINAYTGLVSVVSNIVGNVLLIPVLGGVGAAVSTNVSYMINLVLKKMTSSEKFLKYYV